MRFLDRKKTLFKKSWEVSSDGKGEDTEIQVRIVIGGIQHYRYQSSNWVESPFPKHAVVEGPGDFMSYNQGINRHPSPPSPKPVSVARPSPQPPEQLLNDLAPTRSPGAAQVNTAMPSPAPTRLFVRPNPPSYTRPAQTNTPMSSPASTPLFVTPSPPSYTRPAQTNTPMSSPASTHLFVTPSPPASVWDTNAARIDLNTPDTSSPNVKRERGIDISSRHIKRESSNVQSWMLMSPSPDATTERDMPKDATEAESEPTHKPRMGSHIQLESIPPKPSNKTMNIAAYEEWRSNISSPESSKAWSSPGAAARPLPLHYLARSEIPSKRLYEKFSDGQDPVNAKKMRSERSRSNTIPVGDKAGRQRLFLKSEFGEDQSRRLLQSVPEFPLPPLMSPLQSTSNVNL